MKTSVQLSRKRTIEADKLFNVPWCIRRESLHQLVDEYTLGTVVAYWDDDDEEEEQEDACPYAITADGIALIPITGSLTREDSWWRRVTTYGRIEQMAAHAYANEAVK